MALPTIRYDASAGSDTLSSGAGPDTPVNSTTESSQAYSGDGAGGGTQTIITFDSATDLSGVNVDGSHALWLNNTAGERHIFKIVGKGADTVTVSNAPSTSIASGSPVNWAIGGWRQTLENDTTQPDWTDSSPAWTLEFKEGAYEVENEITHSGDNTGYITWQAESGAASLPIVRALTGVLNALFNANSFLQWKRLKIDANGAVTSNVRTIRLPAVCQAIDCEITGATDSGMSGIDIGDINRGRGLAFFNCLIHGNSIGINQGARARAWFFGCKIYSNTDIGAKLNDTDQFAHMAFQDCLIYDNTNAGIVFAGGFTLSFGNCVFEDNGGDGIDVTGMDDEGKLNLVNNIFSKNGGYGVNYPASEPAGVGLNQSNAYHNNGVGARNNWPVGTNDIEEGTLTTDPFVSSGTNDYHLNDSASGGALLRATGAVGDTNQDGSRDNFPDFGALQHEDTGGGGGGGGRGYPRGVA